MKLSLLFLAAASVTLLCVSAEDISDAQKQHDINSLLWKVNEHIRDKRLREISQNFDPEADKSHCKDGGKAVHKLMMEKEKGYLLEQQHWFSLFDKRHRREALMLFEVFMQCDNWNTLISNAAYFRERMNEGEFTYALYVMVIHHPLTEHVVLPPLYEVTPHLFTNSEVIEAAYQAKMTQTPAKLKSSFTGTEKNPEQRVAYFGEDIGMNTHHVFWHMEFPFWWQDSYGHHLDRKGENFYWVHHQLTVRFDAERISNYLDPVEELQWDHEIVEGFAPHTAYKYGGSFPARPDHAHFQDVDGVARVRDMIIMENRIRDAISHGYIIKEDGSHLDIMNDQGIIYLGDIIESSMYSPNVQYYGALHNTAHIMLGRQGDPHGKFDMPPGVMEHFETATRDPGFFRLHKYMDNIFRDHQDTLPHYTREELDWPGVSVDNIGIDGALETYLEDFEYSLINAVDDTEEIPDIDIDTYVPRQNHKDFNFIIDVKNDLRVDKLATVRIYIWPSEDNNGVKYSFNDGRWNAIELDKFWVMLHPGENHIVRKSRDSAVTSHDVPSFKTLIEKTEKAFKTGDKLNLHDWESATGLPNRFLIPKGRPEGMEFDFFVAVTDGEFDTVLPDPHLNKEYNYYGAHGVYPDKRPHGYPLERSVSDERIFLHDVTNFKHTHVRIYNHDEHIHYHDDHRHSHQENDHHDREHHQE